MPMDQRLLNRLRQLEHDAAQEERDGLLNPDADLGGLDPAWVAEEVARCRADPEYFIDNYCMVESDTGQGVVPFHLFEYQRDVLRQWMEHRESITLKARQLGITELAAALALWVVDFHPHNRVIVFSQDESKAKEFSRKCRVAWENLPIWLQTPVSNPQLTTTLELANGSRILPQAATEKAARSLNCQLLVLDEFAHQEYGAAIFDAAAVTARSAGQRILVISTANGAGNAFHIHWQQAVEGTGLHPIFLPWNIRPGRDETWYREATKGYAAYKKHQEFPLLPEQAFILSGRGRFDTEALDAILAACSEPIHIDQAGGLRVWQMPVQGRRYVIGADSAEGLGKGDYSAAIVLDWETGQDVAEIHGHIPPEQFAACLHDVGLWYNTALIGCERNNHGHAVLLVLSSHLGYPALYAHTEYDASLGATPRLGWPTNRATKPVMIDGLAAAIREQRPYHNAALLGECRTYVMRDNGDTGASGALHDDRVMAAAIAEVMRRYPVVTEEIVGMEEIWTQDDERSYQHGRVRIGGDVDPLDPYQQLRRHLRGDQSYSIDDRY